MLQESTTLRHKAKRFTAVAAAFMVTAGGLFAVPAVYAAEDTPELTSVVTVNTAQNGLDVSVSASGLPTNITGVYAALIKAGSDANVGMSGGYTAFALPFPTITAGETSFTLSALTEAAAGNEALDRTQDYEVVIWKQHSGFEGNVYARGDVEITEAQWDEIFGPEEPPAPVYNPQLSVSKSTDLVVGEEITVTGTGYNPAQSIYVTTCTDIDVEDLTFDFINDSCTAGAKLVWAHGTGRGVEFAADGSFELTIALKQREGSTALYTLANHLAQDDRTQDAKVSLTFAEDEGEPGEGEPGEGEPGEGESSDGSVAPKITLSASSVAQGGSITFTGEGFKPGSEITGTVYSKPYDLGVATADKNGKVVFKWRIPADFEAGKHTLELVSGDTVLKTTFTVNKAANGDDENGADENGDDENSIVDQDGDDETNNDNNGSNESDDSGDKEGSKSDTKADGNQEASGNKLANTGGTEQTMIAGVALTIALIVTGAVVMAMNRRRESADN